MKISKFIFRGWVFSMRFSRTISTEPFIRPASQRSLYAHSKGHAFALPTFKIFDRFSFDLLDEDTASNKGFWAIS